MRGVNIDPANPAGRPSPARLLELGIQWVRIVSRRDVDIREYRDAGLKVIAVVASESGGYLAPGADLYQIGNEPDLDSPSSWTMSPDEYVAMWWMYRATYPGLPMIAAGLASGQVDWWRQVAPHIHGADGFAVHPYAKTAPEARAMLAEYKAVRPDLPLYVTEYHRPVDQIADFSRMLADEAELALWFCWSDGMVPGFGLLDSAGNDKPELQAFTQGDHLDYVIGEGFRNRIAELGLTPKSDETYFTPDLSIVLTDQGPLWYTSRTNEVLGPFADAG